MIYFDLENGYESFKELFGMRKTNDGQKVRKDKVTLNVWKDLFRNKANAPKFWESLYITKAMAQPKSQMDIIMAGRKICGGGYTNFIMDGKFQLSSDDYQIDNGGLCFDGDTRAIRYIKDGHIYKMKASKLYGKIFCEHGLDKKLGTRVQIFCGEKFAEEWCAWAEQKIGDNTYTLHTGKSESDFEKIYSGGGFGSCMSDGSQYYFYTQAVDATAAWLEDAKGNVVCRCVIFDECRQDSTGKIFRIAERQYAQGEDDKLKNILIARLYAAGLIDAHKRVGAPCNRDGWQEICNREGNYLDDCEFSIRCNLDFGDTLSYQDSFKEYDMDARRAYNHGSFDYSLDTTDSEFETRKTWCDWALEYYDEQETYEAYWWDCNGYRHSGYVAECNIDEYFTRVDRGEYYGDRIHEDDVVSINGEDWCKYDNAIVEIDGEWYERGCGCEYCEDSGEYETDYIDYGGYYYADYSWSELLEENLPDNMFDDIENEYAKEHGYVRDDNGKWVYAEELEEVVA